MSFSQKPIRLVIRKFFFPLVYEMCSVCSFDPFSRMFLLLTRERMKKKNILSLKVISLKTFSRVVLISFFSYNWEDPFKRYSPIEQPQSLDIIKQVNKRENHRELCIEDDGEKWLLMQHHNNNKLLKTWSCSFVDKMRDAKALEKEKKNY